MRTKSLFTGAITGCMLIIFFFQQTETFSQSFFHPAHKHSLTRAHPEGEWSERKMMPISDNRSLTMRPVFETDSFYDVQSASWYYSYDAMHSYYQSNCLDSVITNSINGNNDFRYFYQYSPPHNYQTYILGQMWNGTSWDNSFLSLTQLLPSPTDCFYQNAYDFSWNGITWDTTYGRKTTQVVNDSWGNPTLIVRQEWLSNGNWRNYSSWNMSYDALHRLHAQTFSLWDTTLSQFIPLYRDTNFVFSSFTDNCNFFIGSVESQDWNGTALTNSAKYFYYYPANNQEFYSLNWNGSAYVDSSYKAFNYYDNYGNYLGETDYYYDTGSNNWIMNYYDSYLLSYDVNNNVIRIENQNDFYSTPDSIFPNSVKLYSSFTPCAYLQGVNENAVLAGGILLSPNPAMNELVVLSSEFGDKSEIAIYNVLGEKVFFQQQTTNDKQQRVDISQLLLGIYFVKVKTSEGIRAAKFVKE